MNIHQFLLAVRGRLWVFLSLLVATVLAAVVVTLAMLFVFQGLALLILLMTSMAGHDPKDSTSADVPVPDFEAALKTHKVRYEMLTRLGYFVTESSEHFAEYTPYFIKEGREDIIEKFGIPLDEYPKRCVEQIARWKATSEQYKTANTIEIRESIQPCAPILSDPTQIHQIVIKEAHTCLQQAKDMIVDYIDAHWNSAQLEPLPALLGRWHWMSGESTALGLEERLQFINGTTEYKDLAEVDLVIEAVFENPDTHVRRYAFSEHNWHDYEANARGVRDGDQRPGPVAAGLSPRHQPRGQRRPHDAGRKRSRRRALQPGALQRQADGSRRLRPGLSGAGTAGGRRRHDRLRPPVYCQPGSGDAPAPRAGPRQARARHLLHRRPEGLHRLPGPGWRGQRAGLRYWAAMTSFCTSVVPS